MSPETAEAIETAFRIGIGAFVGFALVVFIWTVSVEIRDREARSDKDRRR